MQEVRRRKISMIGLRARVPLAVRFVALAVLVVAVVFVGVSFFRTRTVQEFVMRGKSPELSRTVMREVSGYEQRIMEGDRLRLHLRADREITYTDGHHELQGVNLEAYSENPSGVEDKPHRIQARSAIYDPDEGTVSFNGDVNIETRDSLTAQTQAIVYHQRTEQAETSVPIDFQRENVHGRADAANLDAKGKRLQLRGAVEITVEPNSGANQSTTSSSQLATSSRKTPALKSSVKMRAPQADFDQKNLHFAFTGGATVEQERDLMSGDRLAAKLGEDKKVRKVEAVGNAYLRSMTEGRAAEVSGERMDFDFDDKQRFQHAVATGNVRARSLDSDAEMNLQHAATLGVNFDTEQGRSVLREMRADGRPTVTLSAPRSHASDSQAANKQLTGDNVQLHWRATGRDLEQAEVVGNAELVIEPVNATLTAERKTLTASRFDCDFYETGNVARTFTATGSAENACTARFIPLQPAANHPPRTLTAPKMVASFRRETGDAEKFNADGGATFREGDATAQDSNVQTQRTLNAQKMSAAFPANGGQVERIDADGDARFNEGDRNGQANSMSYTTSDGIVRLRGGEPVAWDSRARLKANEIDSNMKTRTSYARGRVATTYYNQEQTGGATPFAKVKSPVFITSANAEFGHDTGIGVYTGTARAWQDDNFVQADRITLRRDAKRMDANGNVQSALYQAKRKDATGTLSVVPVFATSTRMYYSDSERLLHYESDVDIKQGTERITAEVANVFMQKSANEVERTVAERRVVVTQPGKRATGDWAQYTAADETVMLTGNPAHVEDAEQGTTESRRLTVYLRENRVTGDDSGGQQGTGRVRSTHKIRRQ